MKRTATKSKSSPKKAPSADPKTGPAKPLTVATGEAGLPRCISLPGAPSQKAPAGTNNGTVQIAGVPGETEEEFSARIAFHPAMQNALVAKTFIEGSTDPAKIRKLTKELDFGASAEAMVQKLEALNRGSTQEIEHTLMSQAVALQAIFAELTRRAALNMGTYIEPTEVYLRLALRAQSQARATLETLAEIKNPRPVYINPGQVNHSAGAQQVNNTAGPQQINNDNGATTRVSGKNEIETNKLLGEQ